jgi:hypothetical protein
MPGHNDGDVYPNDGETFQQGAYYPGTPEEQAVAEKEEAAKKSASFPILGDLAEWFEQQIKACDDIHAIQITTMEINGVKFSRKVSVEAQVLAMQLLKERFTEKYHEFEKFGPKDE